MAASTIAKFFPSPCFRHSTRVSNAPAAPTIEQPGSTITVLPPRPRASTRWRRPRITSPAVGGALSRYGFRGRHRSRCGAIRCRPIPGLAPGRGCDPRHRDRRQFGDLRADVAVDAHDLQVGRARGPLIRAPRVGIGDAELVVLNPVEMYGCVCGSTSGLTRTDTRCAATARHRHGLDQFEFRFRLDVEAANAGRQRGVDLAACLADAREDDALRIGADGQRAGQFAAADDVEPAAFAGKQVEDGQVGIGLHRVAHERRPAAEGVGVGTIRRDDRAARIDESRRAERRAIASSGTDSQCSCRRAEREDSVSGPAAHLRSIRPLICDRPDRTLPDAGRRRLGGRWRRRLGRQRPDRIARIAGHVQRTLLAAGGRAQTSAARAERAPGTYNHRQERLPGPSCMASILT